MQNLIPLSFLDEAKSTEISQFFRRFTLADKTNRDGGMP